jgi:uncharacterized low-complexity protein
MTNSKTTLSLAISSAFCASVVMAPVAQAADNPFAMQRLGSGYMVADMGKGMDGKCGGMGKRGSTNMPMDSKCGMDVMDTNKDGKVSRDEFMKAHQAMFDAMDTNKDGMIDADEMKAAGGVVGAKKSTDGKCGDMKK